MQQQWSTIYKLKAGNAAGKQQIISAAARCKGSECT